MEDRVHLAATQKYEALKAELPSPFANKLIEIRGENKPAAINEGIIDLLENFFSFMTFLLLSQYFFDRIGHAEFRENQEKIMTFNKQKLLFSDKVKLVFDILDAYKKKPDLLQIEGLYHTFCEPHDNLFFITDTIRELKSIDGLQKFLKGLKETNAFENISDLFMRFRNKWAHFALPKASLLKSVQLMWHAVVCYFSAMTFFKNYTIGYLSEKHEREGKEEKDLVFWVLKGTSKLDKYVYFTTDEIYNELEIDQIYLGRYSPEDEPVKFEPLLSLHPLVIFRKCHCKKCSGEKTLFFADSLDKDNFSYKSVLCSTPLKPDNLKERIDDFLELLFNPQPAQDLKTFKCLKFLRERYKALYRDFVILAFKDGVVGESEKRFLENKRKLFKIEPGEAHKIEKEVRNNPEIQNNIKNFLSGETKSKMNQLKETLRVAWMDGYLAEGEHQQIERIRKSLGIREREAERLSEEVKNEPEVAKRIENYMQDIKEKKAQLYKSLYEFAVVDGEASKNQLEFLQKKRQQLQLDEQGGKELEMDVRNKLGLKEIPNEKDRETLINNLIDESVEMIDNRDFDRAIQVLKKATFYKPKKSLSHRLMGYAYLMKDDYPEAIRCFFNAYLIKGSDFLTNFYLAKALYKAHKYTQALLFAKHCIELEPQNPDGYILAAHIHYKYLKGEVKAIDILTKGLRHCEHKKDAAKKIYGLMVHICKEKDDKNLLNKIESEYGSQITGRYTSKLS